MPKFKEVVPLQTMAMDLFIESVIQCCDRLDEANDKDLFRSGVIAIRTEVHRYLPGPLLAEFGNRFFEKYRPRRAPQCFNEPGFHGGLEMIMDIKIVGLRLRSENLEYLDLRDGQRFPGLEELDLTGRCGRYFAAIGIHRYLPTFNTNFLTKFVKNGWFNDDNLAIIGQLCQNLEVLKITECGRVTDEGLRALSPCSNLRCVHFRRCVRVSHLGLNHLLSAHKKLEDFHYEPNDDFKVSNFDTNIDVSSGLDLSVTVPSLKSLIIRMNRKDSPALNLAAMVEKFPNLNNLEINCPDALNLSALKHMDKLTGLKIYLLYGIQNENLLQQTWGHIEEILSSIGQNVITLTFWAFRQQFSCRQEQLDMIYNRCPNLEHLAFDHVAGILMVPEFGKLKALTPCSPSTLSVCNLKLSAMLNLEILSLPYSGRTINLQTITGMMFDDKFPKLSVLRMDTKYVTVTRRSVKADLEEIKQIVKDNNLDFRVISLFDRTFVCDYFTTELYANIRDDSYEYSTQYSSDVCIRPRYNVSRPRVPYFNPRNRRSGCCVPRD